MLSPAIPEPTYSNSHDYFSGPMVLSPAKILLPSWDSFHLLRIPAKNQMQVHFFAETGGVDEYLNKSRSQEG